MNHAAVEDWLRIRRQLLEMEVAFTGLAIRVAEGQASQEALRQERQTLEATRQLCTEAYERAFPRNVPAAAGGTAPA